jgi:methylenetetrahydrofolate dehydrogenase (NADP+)/methenyltetrahydrofolate cyclohydrolase
MYKVLSGVECSEEILEDVKSRIAKLRSGTQDTQPRIPKLVIVQIGENPASTAYVGMKIKRATALGMEAQAKKLPEETTEDELLDLVRTLNTDESVHGFIVQLPLPKHIKENNIIEAIDPKKDVDGFTSTNIGKLVLGTPESDLLLPATPAGIIKMLEFYNVEIAGKHAVIVGRSNIVGKPIASMLLNRSATVTICHSKTKDLAKHTTTADILIAAVGKPGLITQDHVKEGAYVIDVGTTKVEGKLKGDVDFENVIKIAHCSPVPKGVGPMTVAMLINNVIKASERSQ